MSGRRLANCRHMHENGLDAVLFGLSLECPFGCDDACPMHPLRNRPLCERFREIAAMSHAGKVRLMARMVTCYTALEAGRSAAQNT